MILKTLELSAGYIVTSSDGVSGLDISTGAFNQTVDISDPNIAIGRELDVAKTDSGVGEIVIDAGIGSLIGRPNVSHRYAYVSLRYQHIKVRKISSTTWRIVGGPLQRNPLKLSGAGCTLADHDGYEDIECEAGAADRTIYVPLAAPTNSGSRRRIYKPSSDTGAGEVKVALVGDTHGTGCFRAVKTNAAGNGPASICLSDNIISTDLHGITAGTNETKSVDIYIPSASGILGSEILFLIIDFAAGSWQTTSQAAANTYDAWQTVSVTRAIRAGATGASIKIEVSGNAESNEYFFADNFISGAGVVIDRGDCEISTSPMMTGETVPNLSAALWYLVQPPAQTSAHGPHCE